MVGLHTRRDVTSLGVERPVYCGEVAGETGADESEDSVMETDDAREPTGRRVYRTTTV